MSEEAKTTSEAATPLDPHQALLLDRTEVQTKVGAVAKFNDDGSNNNLDENVAIAGLNNFKNPKDIDLFVGLSKEELKEYINNKTWRRVRWIIAIVYVVLLVALLAGAIFLAVTSPKCPPRPKLNWYQKEIIYEVDVTKFFDSDKNGIGDVKGIQEKINYFTDNSIHAILFQSTFFNKTSGTSTQLQGSVVPDEYFDLKNIDPEVGSDSDLKALLGAFKRGNMHLLVDLPISSIRDPKGRLYYGPSKKLASQVQNPCSESKTNLGCRYYEAYGRLPLDFSNDTLRTEAEEIIHYWLKTKEVDGVRVDLPLFYNSTSKLYEISYETIDRWNSVKQEIEKTTDPKALIFDVPFALQDITTHKGLNQQIPHALYIYTAEKRHTLSAYDLDNRIRYFEQKELEVPKFWQLGSKRKSDEVGMIRDEELKKEMVLTSVMLLGGTPVMLYGHELGLDQILYPFMPWGSGNYSGFSECSSKTCSEALSKSGYQTPPTNVQRQKAVGGSKVSILALFRRLSKLRRHEAFQFGLVESGFNLEHNVFWFIREAAGHRGFIIVFNLHPTEKAHLPLHEMTKGDVPLHVHYEYQWPEEYLSSHNNTHINSDNILLRPQSINIFWWTAKLMTPDVLSKKAHEHSHNN